MYGNTNTLNGHVDYTKKEWLSSEYYKEVLNFLSKKEIKSFIDIGSCTGVLCDILFEKIPSINYGVLVEANPNNFQFIKKRLSNFDKIDIINNALFYGKNILEIGEVNNNVGAWSYKSNTNKIEIITITFEDIISTFFNSGKLPDFVKIDIEGAEYNFLQNSTKLKDIPYIEIEFHNNDEYGIIEGKTHVRNKIWRPLIEKYLPNHELILGGNEEFYDGSGLFKLKNL